MDTRTVISGISYGEGVRHQQLITTSGSPAGKKFFNSLHAGTHAFHTFDDVLRFVTKAKCNFELDVQVVPLSSLEHWKMQEDQIVHDDGKYFKVIATEIMLGSREVSNWTQPMIEPAQDGICAFVCKEIHGIVHFAVQAKLECGNMDIVEFAPTVQCLTGDYREAGAGIIPFLNYILSAPHANVVYDSMQSEEGGRFYQEQNRNMIIFAGDEVGTDLPPDFIWMTWHQLSVFLKFNNYLNIQARSLLSAISFID